MLEITYKESKNKIQVLELKGDLDVEGVPILQKELNSLMEEGKYKIILDFSNVDFVSSAGVGVIIANLGEIRRNGGDIKFARLPTPIHRVFEIMNLVDVFTIDDSIEKLEKTFTKN